MNRGGPIPINNKFVPSEKKVNVKNIDYIEDLKPVKYFPVKSLDRSDCWDDDWKISHTKHKECSSCNQKNNDFDVDYRTFFENKMSKNVKYSNPLYSFYEKEEFKNLTIN